MEATYRLGNLFVTDDTSNEFAAAVGLVTAGKTAAECQNVTFVDAGGQLVNGAVDIFFRQISENELLDLCTSPAERLLGIVVAVGTGEDWKADNWTIFWHSAFVYQFAVIQRVRLLLANLFVMFRLGFCGVNLLVTTAVGLFQLGKGNHSSVNFDGRFGNYLAKNNGVFVMKLAVAFYDNGAVIEVEKLVFIVV